MTPECSSLAKVLAEVIVLRTVIVNIWICKLLVFSAIETLGPRLWVVR